MGDNDIRDGAGPGANENVDVGNMHAPIYREYREPQDGFEPVPIAWILLGLALAMWSGWYLARFGANFSSAVYDGSAAPAATAKATETKPPDPIALGRRTFNNCMACHQQQGQGLPGQYPPLANSEWVLGDPATLCRILLHGLSGSLQVLGNTYNGAMPAWERLSDEQIAAVLTFIRASWGNQATAIEPDAVAAVRRETAGRTHPWTQEELRAVRP